MKDPIIVKVTLYSGRKKKVFLVRDVGAVGRYFAELMNPKWNKIVLEKPKPEPLRRCKGFLPFKRPKLITGIQVS